MVQSRMTRSAVTNEISNTVRFLVLSSTKFPKRDNVVNIQLPAEVLLGLTTLLATVVITSAGITALVLPVWAIIRLFPTFPAPMVWARYLRHGYACPGTRNMLPVAGQIAKTASRPFRFFDGLVAFFTLDGHQFYDAEIPKLGSFGNTGTRAVFARPAYMIPEFFLAGWASCRDALRCFVAFAGTMHQFSLGRRNLEFFTALRADFLDARRCVETRRRTELCPVGQAGSYIKSLVTRLAVERNWHIVFPVV